MSLSSSIGPVLYGVLVCIVLWLDVMWFVNMFVGGFLFWASSVVLGGDVLFLFVFDRECSIHSPSFPLTFVCGC